MPRLRLPLAGQGHVKPQSKESENPWLNGLENYGKGKPGESKELWMWDGPLKLVVQRSNDHSFLT